MKKATLFLTLLFLATIKIQALSVGSIFERNKMAYLVTSVENSTVALIQCWGEYQSVTIPETVGGKVNNYWTGEEMEVGTFTVTAIGAPGWGPQFPGVKFLKMANTIESIYYKFPSAETYLGDVEEIILSSKLTTIPEGPFKWSDNLKVVRISSNSKLEEINPLAFYGCSSLEAIQLPNSLRNIGKEAFKECTSLEELQLPKSLTTIGDRAFEGCTALEYVSYGSDSKLESIGKYAFYNCISLKGIGSRYKPTLPDGIKTIEEGVFGNCAFDAFELPTHLTAIGDFAFSGCKNLTRISVTDEVTSIGVSAFVLCTNLKTVLLPASLESIGNGAFGFCPNIGHVYAFMADPFPIEYNTFDEAVYRNARLLVHEVSKYEKTFAWSEFKHIKDVDGSYEYAVRSYDITAIGNGEVVVLPDKGFDLGAGWELLPLSKGETIRNEQKIVVFRHWVTQTGADLELISDKGYKVSKVQFAKTWTGELEDVTSQLEPLSNGKMGFHVSDLGNVQPKIIVTFGPKDGTEEKSGDLTGDDEVDGMDLVALVNQIMGQLEQTADADINDDGEVNGMDYVALVNIIMAAPAQSRDMTTARNEQQLLATTNAAGTSTLSIEPFDIKAGESKTMLIDLSNPDQQVTMVEFYIQLPEGLTVAEGEDNPDIAGRTTWKKHSLYMTPEGNTSHVMLASATNQLLSGNSGAIISIQLMAGSGFNGGTITLKKQIIGSPDMSVSKPDDYSYTIKGGDTPPAGDFIVFADAIVEKLCLYYWDTNKDGKLSKQEAAAVTSLGDVFCLDPTKTKSWQGSDVPKDGLEHVNFTSFDELQYFTGLNSIDEGAFYGQQSLQSVTLPASVKTIGKYAFYYCWNLKAINVPNSVETIGEGAFYSCKNAATLVLGSSVKTIGNASFRDCGKLTEVTIPEGCSSIGGSAFLDCTKLTKVTLPATLKNVGSYMIAYAENTVNIHLGSKDLWQQLNIVYLADDNEDEEGIVEYSDYRLYYNGQELTEVDLPQTMTSIGNNFKNCQSIRSLTIPKTMTSLAVLAFNGCRNLTSVTSYVENPFYIEDAVFEYTDPNTHKDVFTSATLYVPKGTKAKYQSQYGWKNFKNIVEMGGEPAEAESYAVFNNGTMTFYYDNLKSVREGVIIGTGNGSNYPGWYPLYYSVPIYAVTFDTSFKEARPTSTYYWFGLFKDLTKIEGIENLNTSEVIDMSGMFAQCSKLTSLDLSGFDTGNVTNMQLMFDHCTSLEYLDLSSFDTRGVNNMNQLFNGCTSLKTLVFGNKFVSEDTGTTVELAFDNCTNLKTVRFTGDIPASINSTFFKGVGTADSPATLDVPEQYREHYKAKFNGNMFCGGYFTLSGEENPNKPEMSVCVINAVDGVVYEKNVKTRMSFSVNSADGVSNNDACLFWYRKENGSWNRVDKTPVWSSLCFYNKDCANGFYKIDYGYSNATAGEVVLGTVEFEVREDNRYSVVVIDSVGDDRMITYSDKQDLDFSSIQGMKAYVAGGFNTNTAEVMLMRVTDVPANTGLLLVGNPGCYLIPRSQSHCIYVNLMKAVEEGLYVPAKEGDNTNYYFSVPSNQFQMITDANGWLAYANGRHGLAYLQIPTQAAGSRQVITLKFDYTDAIADVQTDGQPFDVYSLSGQLVKRGATSLGQLPRGIYIVNGRKVAVK